MKIVSARVEEEHSLFVRDIGANVEEFKIEMHSEVEELKKKMDEGVHERQALEQKVTLLSQSTSAAARPPASAPVVVPDPLLQHLPTLASKVDACMAGYMGVHQKLTLYNSSNQRSFQSAQNQFLAQTRDIASLKSANESLGAQNAKLTAQVAELGKFLNLVITQTSQTSQLVAQSQYQGQAVQGGYWAWKRA